MQAEGPPGAVLSPLRRVLRGATGTQLAFYFVHWLTDLSGAEGTPLAGAERFTRKFPLSVLICFLWSMPYLQRLAEHSETEVVQDLSARPAPVRSRLLASSNGTRHRVARSSRRTRCVACDHPGDLSRAALWGPT